MLDVTRIQGRDSCVASNRRIYLPAQWALSGKVLNNLVQQLHQPDMYEDAEVEPYSRQRVAGSLVMQRNGTRILVVSRRVTPPSDIDGVLHVPGGEMPSSPTPFGDRGRRARWLKPQCAGISSDHAATLQRHCEQVRTSWQGQFMFRTEQRQRGILWHLAPSLAPCSAASALLKRPAARQSARRQCHLDMRRKIG
jgi:hypothetical protein